MKAICFHKFGAPEVRSDPRPGSRHQSAQSVSPWGIQALPPEWQPAVAYPAIPGSDISGVVEAGADDVEGLAPDHEVFAMIRFPSIGESLAVPNSLLPRALYADRS